jgi:tRNA A-37 threonylcarbamoyl transferase component Bud32
MAVTAGQSLQNRYRIVAALGQGGMGAVYKAWDTRLDTAVAVKEMSPQPGLGPEVLAELRKQFRREATVLARLNHPNLVDVTDFFEEGGNAYLVMRFIDGDSLAQRIAHRGPLPETELISVALQLLAGLDYCHSQGVLHRDIKPQNIIITSDGTAVLVDFGLVKLWDPQDPRTRTAMRGMGTPEYAPPEQYDVGAGHTDPRSDIYGLGATLYHALCGQAPPTATHRVASGGRIRSPRQIKRDVSPDLEAAVLKSIELAVTDRYPSAREMAAAVAGKSGTQDSKVASRGAVARPGRAAGARRKKGWMGIPFWTWALGSMAVMLLCTVVAVSIGVMGGGGAASRESVEMTLPAEALASPSVATQAAASARSAQLTATTEAAVVAATLTAEARATEVAAAQEDDTYVVASQWPVLVYDDFNTNDRGWKEGDYSDERLTGNRTLSNGKYLWEANALDGVVWWSVPDLAQVSHCYLAVDARVVRGPEDASYGLIFARKDTANYGFFRVDESSQRFKVSVLDDGTWSSILKWTESPAIRAGDTNRISVVVRGDEQLFFVNGEFAAKVSDDRLAIGSVGLAIDITSEVDSALFEFDGFELRAP